MNSKIEDYQSQLHSLSNQIKVHSRQYELFCGLMAMVAESPSVTDSIDILIATFQKLKEAGWYLSKNADEMRSLFIRTVMGDYLRCFRCDTCGAKFMVNQEPYNKFYTTYYKCPACHYSHGVKDDDSFLKAMVSEEQLENTQRIKEVLKENKVLKPLKAFLDVPCEICGELITEWTEQNVKMAVGGFGWGHSHCWNSDVGHLRHLGRLAKEMQGNC